MRKHETTFVSPGYSDELPRLPAPAKLPDIEAQQVDPGKLFGKTPVHTHERRDPIMESQAFMLKYAGLTVILLILAIGLTIRLEWHYSIGIITFAGLAVGAYWLLALSENLFTGPGVERHRLTQGARVLTRQIEADERVRLASIGLQADQVSLQRAYNDFVTQRALQRANADNRLPDSRSKRLNDAEATQDTCEATQTPGATQQAGDSVLDSLLSFVVTLYQRDDAGMWLHMDRAGYVSYELPVCWGRRGGHTQADRRRMVDTIRRARFAGFDDSKRAWRISVKRYPDPESAIDALGAVATSFEAS